MPVPRTLAFCDDDEVNDAPFYVMEKVDGQILRDAGRDRRRSRSDDAAALLRGSSSTCSSQIHAVDYDAVGLADFGRPDGYLERQVRRWGEQWERSKTRELPGDRRARRAGCAPRCPSRRPPTIVHGDYRLDNTMLAPDDPGRIVAVLDWEMATLGDPLADLGLFLLYWASATRTSPPVGATIDSPTRASSPATRSSSATPNAAAATSSQLDFYEVFASYKLAIILEGIHARFLMGKTLGEGFDAIGCASSTRSSTVRSTEATRSSIPALRG